MPTFSVERKGPPARPLRSGWEDFRYPATAINPPGAASDPDREATTGLLLFDASGTELIYVLAQMPHAWVEGSSIRPHVHWEKTTDAAGTVAWKLEYQKSKIGELRDAAYTSLGEVTTVVAGTPDTNKATKHLITSLGTIDMSDCVASDCLLFKLSRVGASDTYGADVRLLEFDVHGELDSLGSENVF
jgi:hypothetical protein